MPLTPPRPNTVPLNALRALEAAGRHGSFLHAADELSVTPGAVAQQIKKLEEWAGVSLFDRHRHGVSLTPLGRRLMPQLEQAFDALGNVSNALRYGAERPEIRIAALPAIAQLWLSPRLSELRARVGDADPAIHALDTPPLLGRGDFDLSIYPADMLPNADVATEILAENSLTPVAEPALAAAIQTPEDLKSAVLIHDLAWKQDWATWLNAVGLQNIASERGPTHSLYSIAVERCIAGDGILIGHTALITRHLQSGALQRVFPMQDVPWHNICLLTSETEATDRRVALAIAALSEPSDSERSAF